MSRFARPKSDWNEFQWESEIRRDEKRISCYFRELAGCLDLPGEETMIIDSLMSRPELVPAGAVRGHWRIWDALDDDGGDDGGDDDDEGDGRRFSGELSEQIDKLACEWNCVFALRLRESLRSFGLAVSCGFGKTLARVVDFEDTDEHELRPLKVSLGKRVLSDLNELVGMLRDIGARQRALLPLVRNLVDSLQQIRERMVAALSGLRLEKR